MQGFVILDKPVGATSFSMVGLVRRLTGVRRVGHAGTLDPLASGVLPVAVGQAARFIEYLDDVTKTYVARVRFGVETDTYDAEGAVVATGDASGLTRDAVEAALAAFTGDIEQTPPTYSALKVAGKPLYRYAREGVEVAVRPRIVHVASIALLAFDGAASGVAVVNAAAPGVTAADVATTDVMASGVAAVSATAPDVPAAEAEIEVVCGKGTYIRSIAHDLGRALGCGAHLSGLRRTSSGGFGIDDAISPDALREMAADGRLDEVVLAPDRAVERRPAALLGEATATDVRAGRDVRFTTAGEANLCRAYSSGGDFLGVLRVRGEGVWHPEKVLPRG
jgi:tRNA pseudouridine55 synthase